MESGLNFTIIPANAYMYVGHYNLGLSRDCGRQMHKVVKSIQNFDHFKIGEKVNGEQRKYFLGGVERSGYFHSIMQWDLRGVGVYGFNYKSPESPSFRVGYFHSEASSSGAKKEGIIRVYAAEKNDVCTSCIVSNPNSPLAQMVAEQHKGVQIDWEKVDEQYRDTELEGFRPGKNFEKKRDFFKDYPWIGDPKNLVIELTGRDQVIGKIDEKGLAPAGNLYECSVDWFNKLSALTYHYCKNDLSEKNIMSTFNRLLDENGRALKNSISYVLDQRSKLENMCVDTYNKQLIIILATGSDSGNKGRALGMRGGHAKFTELGEHYIIHVDSENETWMRNIVESLPRDFIKNNVRGITLSESLETSSKPLTKYLRKHGVKTYGITANEKSEVVKEDPESFIIMPNETYYKVGSPLAPNYSISSFRFALMPIVDTLATFWIVHNKSSVEEQHKRGE